MTSAESRATLDECIEQVRLNDAREQGFPHGDHGRQLRGLQARHVAVEAEPTLPPLPRFSMPRMTLAYETLSHYNPRSRTNPSPGYDGR